jgi:polar amino acid transport system permease protein
MTAETIARAIVAGMPVTIELTIVGCILATIMAFTAGLARMSPIPPVRWVASIYIEVFRGTSAFVQLFWFFYVLPRLGFGLAQFQAAALVMGLCTGAYCAEIVRGAIQAVPRGQTEAAIALNLSSYRRMRSVILPQAIVAMIPPMTNMYVSLLKGTALVSLIGLSDMVFRAQALRAYGTGSTLAIFTQLLLAYLFLAMVLVAAMRLLERTLKRKWGLGASHRPIAAEAVGVNVG